MRRLQPAVWALLAIALATVPVAALLGLAVAAPTFAYSATISSDSYLAILFRVGMIPMSLFSGVFFPVESLPSPLRWIAYVLPLWHGVDLSRAATLGVPPDWSVAGHVLYLAAWTCAGWLLAYRRFALDGVVLLGHLRGVAGGRLRFADDLAATLVDWDASLAEELRAIDAYIDRTGMAAPPDAKACITTKSDAP